MDNPQKCEHCDSTDTMLYSIDGERVPFCWPCRQRDLRCAYEDRWGEAPGDDDD